MQNLSLRGDVKTQVLAVGEKEKKLKDAVRPLSFSLAYAWQLLFSQMDIYFAAAADNLHICI